MKIDRVVIGYDGIAVPLEKALEAGVKPEIVFKRDDGWHLATISEFEKVAYEMYKESWIGFARRPDKNFTPINLYTPPVDKKPLSFWE